MREDYRFSLKALLFLITFISISLGIFGVSITLFLGCWGLGTWAFFEIAKRGNPGLAALTFALILVVGIFVLLSTSHFLSGR